MGHHQQQEFSSLRVKVITVSDSRDLDSDKSGALICEKLVTAGHLITSREVVVDTIDNIRHALNHAISDEQAQEVDVLVSCSIPLLVSKNLLFIEILDLSASDGLDMPSPFSKV